jgi:DNA repair photolyase
MPGFQGRNSVHATVKPRDGILGALETYLIKHGAPKEQILISFTSDPFPIAEDEYRTTHRALALLNHYRAKVAILTKGGLRAMNCLSEIQAFGDRIKIGATLTFMDAARSVAVEPGAAEPVERLAMLKTFHALGVKTWVSIEPVIDPEQSLECIRQSLAFTDHFKIGVLNHTKNETNWPKFLADSVNTLRAAGKLFYIKHDLQKFEKESGIILSDKEKDPTALFLK